MPKSKYTPEERRERDLMLSRAAYQRRKEKMRLYYEANKEKYRARDKAWREKNKESFEAQQLAYRQGKKDHFKKYRQENKDKMRPYFKEYARKKRECPIFRLKQCLRTRIYDAIQAAHLRKAKRTMDAVGCTGEFLKKYLEARFRDGMTWDNHGKVWHIDHIIPLSEGKTASAIEKLSHYTNLQPLFWQENLAKGSKRMYQTVLDLV